MNHWYWKKRKPRSQSPNIPKAAPPRQPYLAGATGVTWTYATELPEPAPALKDMGLAIEPIVGARSFAVTIDDGVSLCSLNGVYWRPRVPLAAYCLNNPFADHEPPYEHCSCGIYAWKLDAHQSPAKAPESCSVWGEVYLWGDVLVCDAGYRAEMAYPKVLHINATANRAALRIRDSLEEEYGVPVTFTDTSKVEEVAETSPPMLTSSGGLTAPWGIIYPPPNFHQQPGQGSA